MVSSSGLSSAGSALVESSNVRSFALNRDIVTDILSTTFLEPARMEVQFIPLHQFKAVVSQVGALLLLIHYSYTVGLR